MDELIDSDVLFQALIIGLAIPEIPMDHIAADLDIDAFDHVPFVTHNSTIQQDKNGRGLWTCQLNVTVYLADDQPFTVVQSVYAGIHSWGEPGNGRLLNVAAVETVDDVQAFTRLNRGIPMLNKVVTPYAGSFELTIRNI